MPQPNLVILYVGNPLTSAAFYSELLDIEPVESSPTFVMFALESGAMLGLWSRNTVRPPASMTGGGGELAFSVADAEAVRTMHAKWSKRGLMIAQAPIEMEFGPTFVALDPDGHRLRVFAPTAP